MDKAGLSFRKSLFILAAQYSCLLPFIAATGTGIFIFVLYQMGIVHNLPTVQRETYSEILYIPFLIQAGSLIFGVFSLFGIRKHGTKPILLKAIVGIVASLIFGVIIFALMVRSHIQF